MKRRRRALTGPERIERIRHRRDDLLERWMPLVIGILWVLAALLWLLMEIYEERQSGDLT